MLELELDQRTNIKFLVKLGKSGNEIGDMLVQVYGDNAMNKTAVYKYASPWMWEMKLHIHIKQQTKLVFYTP